MSKFENGKYELRSEFVNLMTAKGNLAIQKAILTTGAYAINSKGELVELTAGMITQWDYWTTDSAFTDDLNRELSEM